MKRYKRLLLAIIFIATSLFLSQCILPERRTDDYSVILYYPLEGAVLSLEETGWDWDTKVAGSIWDSQEPFDTPRENHVVFFANGRTIGELDVTITPSGETTPPAIIDWEPDAVGEYYLQIFSSRRGGWAISKAVRVCVIDFSIYSPELSRPPTEAYSGIRGYEGDCEIPERSPDAAPGPLTFSATASPDPLPYFPGWWDPVEAEYTHEWRDSRPDGCEPLVISFQATASDPNDDIVFVKVDMTFYYNLFPTYESHIRSQTLVLNRESGSSLDSKIFTGEASPPEYYPTEINQTFEIRWTAYAYDRSGDVITSDGPYTISVEPCYSAEMVPLSAPLPSEEPDLIRPSVLPCEGIRGVSIRDNGVMRTNVKVPDVSGEYAATLNDLPISCLFYEAYPDTLLCDSPKPQSNTLATLIIFDDQGNEFCNQTFTVPGPSAGETGKDKDEDEACNLSVAICSAQGLSFDVNNCQCVKIQ